MCSKNGLPSCSRLSSIRSFHRTDGLANFLSESPISACNDWQSLSCNRENLTCTSHSLMRSSCLPLSLADTSVILSDMRVLEVSCRTSGPRVGRTVLTLVLTLCALALLVSSICTTLSCKNFSLAPAVSALLGQKIFTGQNGNKSSCGTSGTLTAAGRKGFRELTFLRDKCFQRH